MEKRMRLLKALIPPLGVDFLMFSGILWNMPQAIHDVQKLHSELSGLKQEVRSLRSLVIGLVSVDKEGQYRPEFVREILRAARQKPRYIFKDVQTFREQLRRA